MIRVLIPVFLLAIVAITILIIHKRESKVDKVKRLERENKELVSTLKAIDTAAQAEYTVNEHNTFAWNVSDKIKDKV